MLGKWAQLAGLFTALVPPPATPQLALWPGWELLGSPDVSVRLGLAEQLGDSEAPFAPAAFWVVSQDAELQVRQVALNAALRRCPAEPAQLCTHLLRLFAADLDEALAWRALDAWLQLAPQAALGAGPLSWRLELLSRISPQRLWQSALDQVVLRRLCQDDDPQVHDHAAWLLEH